MEPPLKKRKIGHVNDGWLSVGNLPGELVEIIISHLEYDLRTILRLSRTCKGWYRDIWSFVSYIDVTHGQPATSPKPIQHQITPLLERIDCSRMKSFVITHKVPITSWLGTGSKIEFGESNKFWIWEYIKNMTRLESLTLLCHNLPSHFFQMCTIFNNLTHLMIECSGILDQPQFMENITYLTSLKRFSFGRNIRTIQALEKLPNLETLHLPQLPVSSFGVGNESITRLNQLRSLSVDILIEPSTKEIVTMTNLMTVIAPGWNVYEPIKNMHNLEYLAAKSIRVTYLPPNLTYLCTPWAFVLTPWLSQITSYEGDLFDKKQLNLFNVNSNITHLSLSATGFTYPLLTMLTNLKSLSIAVTPDLADYPAELFLNTFHKMTLLRRIEFTVSNSQSSFDLAAKLPLKNVVVTTKRKAVKFSRLY